MLKQSTGFAAIVLGSSVLFAQTTAPTTLPRSDANGNPLRLARATGHISNYTEGSIKPYTLPDPLTLNNGQRVTTAEMWVKQRRPEILKAYQNEIYGRVPDNAPKVRWEVASTEKTTIGDAPVTMKKIIGHVGEKADGPAIPVTIYIPAAASGPVPMVLTITFGGGPPTTAPAGRGGGIGAPDASIDQVLTRGYGFAFVGYRDIQPDRADAWTEGVIGATLKPGQTKPAPDEWGTISAWSWALSRIVDYFETDKSVDAKQIAIQGHSRLGKTVLWAGAQDQRIAAVFSSCGGEMGAALARRDYGETVDDMAQNFPWQFAGNFQKYAGHWSDMPGDSHFVISLVAPRPLFCNGGTTDQWADPKGEFLGQVAAGPVYRLLGKKDLGTTELPPLDQPLTSGDLGWNYHTGGHTATPGDWTAFLDFLGKYFKTPLKS